MPQPESTPRTYYLGVPQSQLFSSATASGVPQSYFPPGDADGVLSIDGVIRIGVADFKSGLSVAVDERLKPGLGEDKER